MIRSSKPGGATRSEARDRGFPDMRGPFGLLPFYRMELALALQLLATLLLLAWVFGDKRS